MPLILFMVGFAVGTFGTMVGAGGGFLVVPLLHLVFGFSPLQAVGTSLAMVFMNASSGTLAYARQKRIDYYSGIVFGAATLPAAIVGARVASLFTDRSFRLTFAGLLSLMAIYMLVVKEKSQESALAPVSAAREDAANPLGRPLLGAFHRQVSLADVTGQVFIYSYNLLPGIIFGTLVGLVSSVLGIGGGIIHVPAMIYILGFPAHIATATSHFILVLTALFGVIAHAIDGNVLWPAAIPLGAGAVLGAPLGARLARKLPGRIIVIALSGALILISLRLALS